MAAEAEIQEFFQKAGAIAGAAYHTVMKDGSVEAVGREAIKDVRNTIHEVFFGRSEHGGEPGAPLNPLFHDIVQGRQEHEAAVGSSAEAPPSPADLTDSNATALPHADTPHVSPADLVESQQQGKQGVSPAGLDLPADVLAEVKTAGADVRDSLKDSPADIGREELGQLPTQDPPRQRHKL